MYIRLFQARAFSFDKVSLTNAQVKPTMQISEMKAAKKNIPVHWACAFAFVSQPIWVADT